MLMSINKRVEFLSEELTNDSRVKTNNIRKQDANLTSQMAKFEAALERLKNDNKKFDMNFTQ